MSPYSVTGPIGPEASRRGHDTCPVRSIAAAEVEGLVLGQVRRWLASPELVARTITAVRRENDAAEDAVLDEREVIEAVQRLDPLWDQLFPVEQARIVQLLVERVFVRLNGLEISLRVDGIGSLVEDLRHRERERTAA